MVTEMNELKSQLENVKGKVTSAESMQEQYRSKNSSLRDYTTLLAQQNEQLKSRFTSVESDFLKVNSCSPYLILCLLILINFGSPSL